MGSRLRTGGNGKYPVASHAIGHMAIRAAVEAGVDPIEHGYGVTEKTLELMAANKIFFVVTEESAADANLPFIDELAKRIRRAVG